jgi:hypothetical protein
MPVGSGLHGPAVAVDDEGTILLARRKIRCGSEDPGCDVLFSAIIVQAYSDDGTPLAESHRIGGGDMRVVTQPRVAASGAGAFVVAWGEWDRSSDGYSVQYTNPRIVTRRVDARGAAVGAAEIISTTTDISSHIDVAGSDHGNFVVVWNTSDEEGDRIMAQRYTQLSCNRRPATLAGTPGDDYLTGTHGDDVIVGRAGNDTIEGLDGADLICGNAGNDLLVGGSGSDTMNGGNGSDTIRGRANDTCIDRGGGTGDISCE